MRILYCQKLIFPKTIAHAIHTAMTAANFADAGAEVLFFPGLLRGDITEWQNYLKGLGFDGASAVDIRAIPYRHKGLYGLFFRWALLKAMLEKKSAICYASNVKDVCIALTLRKLCRIPAKQMPVVFEIHHFISKLKQGKQAKKLLALEKKAFAEADLVVFISKELRSIAHNYLHIPESSIISPLGFNAQAITPIQRSAPASLQDNDPVNVFYVGSLQAGKGVDLLIQSFSLLPEKYRLTIVGGATATIEILSNEVKQKALDNRIHFVGQVEQVALRSWLETCDIFAIPTTTYTDFYCPMKMYEAVGFNLPIVATPIPSLQDCLVDGKNAVFAADLNADALAKALLKVGESKKLRDEMRIENATLSRSLSSKERAVNLLAKFKDKFGM
jgi:glycosyltransferase involved in cell wall biosynthesis